MPAPTRVLAVTPVEGWASDVNPKVTPTFDVVAGDLLVYTAFSEDFGSPIAAPTWTGTGVWTLRQSVVVSNYCTAYAYTCAVTATQSGRTVSASRTGAQGGQFSYVVSVWRNHGGVGVSGKANTTGAPSLALTCSVNSALVMGNSDWNAVNGATRTWRTVNGAPITESSYGGNAGVTYVAYTGYAPDAGVAGSKTVGLSAPTGQKYSIVGVEIKAGTGGAAFSGSLATSGSGSAGFASVPAVLSGLALAGAGLLVLAGVPAMSGGLAATGSGTSARAGSVTVSGPLTGTGSGTATRTGSPAFTTPAARSGAGSVTTTGTPSPSSALAAIGSGTVSYAAGGSGSSALLELTGLGMLALSGNPSQFAALDLSGTGIHATSGAPTFSVPIDLSGLGELTQTVVGEAHNVTVTGSLDERQHKASLPARTHTGTITARTHTGNLAPNRWAGTL